MAPHRRYWALGALVALALVLRVWAIDRNPPGLDTDEVAIGYNAYSILRTGRDEYGARLPLTFRSYGEYKRPVYIYAAIPSIAVFGLTPLGVRLPAAILGALSVPAMYAVGVLLLRRWQPALAAAAFLAISPLHLQFTRAAREVAWLVLAVLLLVAALLAAFHARKARPGPLYAGAALAFLLAAYSYPSGPLFAPLLALLLAHAYWPCPQRAPRAWLLGAAAVIVVGALPLAIQFVDGRARTRIAQASIFSRDVVLEVAQRRMAQDRRDGAPWLLQHPWAVGARLAVDGYLSHVSPQFLFTRGDMEWRHRSSDMAHLYLWDLPLLAAGAVRLVRRWRWPAMQVVGGWLLIGPLAAAFSEHAPHAVRSIVMLPAWYLLAAIGWGTVWRWLRRRGYERDWLLLLLFSAGFYLYMYHRYYPLEQGRSWSSGVLEGFRAAQAEVEAGRFDRVVIAQQSGLNYAHALFATAYDPQAYLAQGGTVVDPSQPLRFRPFEMRPVDWRAEPRAPDVLYVVGGGTSIPPGGRVVSTIKGAGGHDAVLPRAFDRPA